MSGAEPASEMTVLPGMIQVETLVMPLMAYPVAGAGVYVRRIRMSGLVAEVAVLRGGWTVLFRSRRAMLIALWLLAACSGRGAALWHVAMTNLAVAGRMALRRMPAVFVAMLAKRHPGLEKNRNRNS